MDVTHKNDIKQSNRLEPMLKTYLSHSHISLSKELCIIYLIINKLITYPDIKGLS